MALDYSCTLYINSSNPNVITKSLSGETPCPCDFKNPMDVENPVVYIGADGAYANYNYMYIPAFGRYYFAKCVGGTSQTLTFECTSDPLMSFKSAILNSKAVISRNPWMYDLYVPDPNLPLESRTVKATFKFPNTGIFDGSHNCYILTTLGCGSANNGGE